MTSLLDQLPSGARLSDESWTARHRILIRLLWLHVPALLLLGVLGPMPGWEKVVLPVLIAGFALGAGAARGKRAKAELTSLGLIGSTFVAIELSGGDMAAHIHLYAILIFVALYQQWTPLIWAVAVVLVHHGIYGTLAPERVFGAGADLREAFLMVGVHAGLATLEVVGIVIFWHFAQQAEKEVEQLAAAAETQRGERELAEQVAVARMADAERQRTAEAIDQATQLASEAEAITADARTSLDAVAAVDVELEKLSAAIREVAQRSSHASETASAGQAAANSATERVQNLERSVAEIAEVNALIAQLAGQTNLLSLNATIEAARAGDLGKGFAVVAGEVKQLATETASSAGEVNRVIAAIVGETSAVAASFTSTASAVEEVRAVQNEIAHAVDDQVALLAEVTEQLSTASQASRQIMAGLDRLTRRADG